MTAPLTNWGVKYLRKYSERSKMKMRENATDRTAKSSYVLPPVAAETLATALASILTEIDKDLEHQRLIRAHLFILYQRAISTASLSSEGNR